MLVFHRCRRRSEVVLAAIHGRRWACWKSARSRHGRSGSTAGTSPGSQFTANAAWLVLAAIAFNLTRAAGCLASAFHAKTTTATIRAQLITVPARIARSARRLRLHLPQHWPWQTEWPELFDAALGPPATT